MSVLCRRARPTPNRTTVPLYARVDASVKALAEKRARNAGQTLSEWLTGRIEDAGSVNAEARPAASAIDLAIVGQRVAATLQALRARAIEGEDLSDAIAILSDVRREVTAALLLHSAGV